MVKYAREPENATKSCKVGAGQLCAKWLDQIFIVYKKLLLTSQHVSMVYLGGAWQQDTPVLLFYDRNAATGASKQYCTG
jgi:hypothetical protein